MSYFRPFSFRMGLIILASLVLLPAVGLILINGQQEREQATRDAELDAQNVAHLVATNQKEVFNKTFEMLKIISHDPVVRYGSKEACSHDLASLKSDLPQYNNITVIAPNGYAICAAAPIDGPLFLGDRPYFLRAMQLHAPALGNYQISRITNQQVIVLALPVLDVKSRVTLMIVAGLDLNWMTRMVNQDILPANSTITVYDGEGTILARSPDPDLWVGKNVAATPLVQTILSHGSGLAKDHGFLYAYETVEAKFDPTSFSGGNISVSVGIPESTAYARVNQINLNNLIGLAVMMLLAFSAAWFGGDLLFLRRIRRLVKVTRLLKEGDLTVRTGTSALTGGELSQLEEFFDRMAETLQDKNKVAALAIQDLLVSEEKFRTLAETVSTAIFIYQGECIRYVNPACSTLTGYTRDELMGMSFWDFVPADLRDFVIQRALARQQGTNLSGHLEFKILTKEGSPRWVDFSAGPVHFAGELAVLGSVIDITERIHNEEKLRDSETGFRLLFAGNPLPMWVYDLQTLQFLEVNEQAVEKYGFSREEFLAMRLTTIHPEEDIPLLEAYLARPRARLQTTQGWRHCLKNGRIIDVEITSHTLDFTGRKAALVVVQDLTERLQAERALQRKLDELTVLKAVATAAAASTNVDELIEQFSLISSEKLYPHHFGVVLVADSGRALRLHPSYRGSVPNPRFDLEPGEGIIGQVIQSGRPLRIAEVRAHPGYRAVDPNILSELCVPIFLGKEVIGAINVESPLLDAFSESDERLLTILSSELETAIEKVRLFEAERRRRQEAETLRKVSAGLTTTLDLKQLLDRLLTHLAEVVPCDSSCVILLAHGSQMEIAAQRGFRSQNQRDVLFFSDKLAHIREVVEQAQAVIIPDTRADPRWMQVPGAEYIVSWMGVPLVVKEQVIGLLSLDKEEAYSYSEKDIPLALSFANQAAAAIENARLFEAERRRSRELAALEKVSTSLRTVQTRSTILEIALEEVMDLLQADGAAFGLKDQSGTEIVLEQALGDWTELSGMRVPLDGSSAGQVVLTNQPYLSNDHFNEPGFFRPELTGRSRTYVAVPLIVQDETLGILSMGRKERAGESEIRLMMAVGNIAANALHRTILSEQTEQRLRRLTTLRTLDMAITGSIDINLTLNILLSEVVNGLFVDAADVLLYDPKLSTLRWAAGLGFHDSSLRGYQVSLVQTEEPGVSVPAVSALIERRPVHVTDLSQFLTDRVRLLIQEGFQFSYVVPFIAKGEVKGVLEIYNRTPITPDQEWQDFLDSPADQAAIAIDNAELFQELERSNMELHMAYDETIEGWSRALDIRDRETENHSQHVTEMTMNLAQAMNLPPENYVHIRRGALLHDIGKVGIPDSILLKAGPLSPEEWIKMRQHPQFAYEMLAPIQYLHSAVDIPYCHHEHWDGSGYPRGLKGEEIPIAARIFTVVDVWDALISDRPYRKAWEKQAALEYIRSESSKLFDPAIVTVFLGWITEKGLDSV